MRAARRYALPEALPEKSRRLIEMRYEPGTNIKQMAKRLGRSAESVYKAVSRAHQALVRCVQETLASRGHA